jgi:hypothetical protein
MGSGYSGAIERYQNFAAEAIISVESGLKNFKENPLICAYLLLEGDRAGSGHNRYGRPLLSGVRLL